MTVGPLRDYTVSMNGIETTVQLNEADARRLGVFEEPDQAVPVRNKMRTTSTTKTTDGG